MMEIDCATEVKDVWSSPSKISMHSVAKNLVRPVDIGPLVALRVAFGLLMAASMVRFMLRGWVAELYVQPSYHFTYAGFGWIRPLPPAGMWLVFIILAVLGLTITAGFLTRISLAAFFLLFTYVELIDKAYYLNHYYFVSLFSFLLIFLPLGGAWSLDGRLTQCQQSDRSLNKKSQILQITQIKNLVNLRNLLINSQRSQTVPAWMVWLVRLQLGLVYFFAGVAKINADWLLNAQPLTIWLHARTSTPLIGTLFDQPWLPLAMSWAGMLFDVTIPFWLSWRKTRLWAYTAVLIFHGLTGLLFNIGMFPWIMIACTLVFFDWRIPGRAAQRPLPNQKHPSFWQASVLALFFLIQLLLPLRHWLYPGKVNWTEEGVRFAWRVMLVEKTGQVTFFVRDVATGAEWLVLPADFLTDQQEKQMSFQPDMIVQFAHFLAEQYPQAVEVRAEAFVSWNGRPSRLLIDPTINLAAANADWHPRAYILK
ncbi:MAG: HTTM domain-containing protein [Anaerolineales bacterium]|nr:HTTM domain-containing protein [Anaerolineales bacterium]